MSQMRIEECVLCNVIQQMVNYRNLLKANGDITALSHLEVATKNLTEEMYRNTGVMRL